MQAHPTNEQFAMGADDDSDEEEEVELNFKFYVKRVSTCICWLGILFGLGFMAMKVRGGEKPFDPSLLICDADALEVSFKHYRVGLTHPEMLPTMTLASRSRRARHTTTIDLLYNPGTWAFAENTSHAHDYENCAAGTFTSALPGVYRVDCSAVSHGATVWGETVAVERDAVFCLLQLNTTDDVIPLRVQTAFNESGNVTYTAPACSLSPSTHRAVDLGTEQCIGRNISIALSTPFDSEVGASANNASSLAIPLQPMGEYNASAEFLLLF